MIKKYPKKEIIIFNKADLLVSDIIEKKIKEFQSYTKKL